MQPQEAAAVVSTVGMRAPKATFMPRQPIVDSPIPALSSLRPGPRKGSRGLVLIFLLGLSYLLPGSMARAAGPTRHSMDRAPVADGQMAVLGVDREVYLEAVALPGEDISTYARRLCGTAAAATPISQVNHLHRLEEGLSYRVPLELLTPALQRSTVGALFPQDRWRAGHWEHWVQNGSRRGLETLWRVARWFTGNGENAALLAPLNGALQASVGGAPASGPRLGGPLGSGRILRIPQELLLPGLRPTAGLGPRTAALEENAYGDGSATLDEAPPQLEYRYDGTGLHAIYRLRPGESFLDSLRRLTPDDDLEGEPSLQAEIASLNGVHRGAELPTGYEIMIPADRLRPELQSPEQLWLPTPLPYPDQGFGLGAPIKARQDFLIGLAVAAPHEITNLNALLSADAAASMNGDPHGALQPDRGRVSQRIEVSPSPDYPDLDILPYGLWIDGKRLAEPIFVHRDGGVLLLPFAPIAEALGHRYRVDAAGRHLVVERSPDGASLSLNLRSGLVIANRRAAGVAPNVDKAKVDALLLPIEATEAMSGANIRRDDTRREIRIEMDARLRAIFGFEVLVEGRPLLFLDPEPRAVGPVLLLPLLAIAEELGDEVVIDQARRTVQVIRAQDNARITLELATGVVRVDDWAAGMVPDMSYADLDNFLLPQAAVEALTGTHVTVKAGTRRIAVDLDPQLRGLHGPRSDAWQEIQSEGWVAERLELRLGNEIPNEVRFRGHLKQYNIQLRYETPDFPDEGVFDPLWASVRIDSLRGWSAILGDSNAGRRELHGVDLGRLRGFSFQRSLDSGELRLMAGEPLRGSRRLTPDVSVPEFDDLALGLRFYAKSGTWEAGFAALDDGGDGSDGARKDSDRKYVASLLHRFERPTPFGELRSYEELDVGAFDGDLYDGGSDVDLRARWHAFLRPSPKLTVSAQARYTGLQFNRSESLERRLERQTLAAEGNPTAPTTLEEARQQRLDDLAGSGDTDRLESRLATTYQPSSKIAFGARFQVLQDGLLDGDPEAEQRNESYGFNVTTQPWQGGPRLGVDYAVADPDERLGEQRSNRLTRLDLSQSLGRFQLVARHEEERGDQRRQLSSLSLRARAFNIDGPDGSALSLSPGLRAFRSQSNDGEAIERGDLDLFAELRSGRLFGRRFEMRMSYARSLAISADDALEDEYQETLSAIARYRLTPEVALEASYIDNLRTDDERFLVRLRAGIDFNPARKYKLPNEGTGVLTGFAFLDANQDGLFQEGETALPGVGIWIRGRRLGLKTDRLGRFTIQNLRAGPYALEVDLDNLPLGLLPFMEQLPRVSVGDGALTHLEIPLILSGQIRGSLFVDANANGSFDPDEQGLEGIKLSLQPTELEADATFTTFFGQFAFDRLRAGSYEVKVEEGFLPSHLEWPTELPVIHISPSGELMQRLAIPLRPRPGLAASRDETAEPNLIGVAEGEADGS